MLERGESGWRVDLARVEEGRVPTTLQGMLQARLDALPPSAREALQRASILGRNFWAGALAALGSGEASLLEALREQGLVLARERSSIAGEREYVFKHALLRDAAYGSLLKRQRPVLHALAADWLIDHAGERYAELAAQIARHAELAGRAAEAARHYRAAAEREVHPDRAREVAGARRLLEADRLAWRDGQVVDVARTKVLDDDVERDLGVVGVLVEGDLRVQQIPGAARALGHRPDVVAARGHGVAAARR